MSWEEQVERQQGGPPAQTPRDERDAVPGLIFLFLFPLFAAISCQPLEMSQYHHFSPHFSEAKGNGSPLFLTALQF